MQQRNLSNITEMAAILGVPKGWLYQRTRLGPAAIPHFKAGKYIRFDPDQVIEFLKKTGGRDYGNR